MLTNVYQPTRGTITAGRQSHHGQDPPDQVRTDGHRPYLPEYPPVRLHDARNGQREGRHAHPYRGITCSIRVFRTAPLLHKGEKLLHANGRWSCWTSSAWRIWPISIAGSPCPTAHSAGWRSCAPWPPSPRFILLDEPAAGMNPSETRGTDDQHPHALRDEFKIAVMLHRARYERWSWAFARASAC